MTDEARVEPTSRGQLLLRLEQRAVRTARSNALIEQRQAQHRSDGREQPQIEHRSEAADACEHRGAEEADDLLRLVRGRRRDERLSAHRDLHDEIARRDFAGVRAREALAEIDSARFANAFAARFAKPDRVDVLMREAAHSTPSVPFGDRCRPPPVTSCGSPRRTCPCPCPCPCPQRPLRLGKTRLREDHARRSRAISSAISLGRLRTFRPCAASSRRTTWPRMCLGARTTRPLRSCRSHSRPSDRCRTGRRRARSGRGSSRTSP